MTIFQLEKIFGKSKDAKAFIQELIKGQKGTPHPQARAWSFAARGCFFQTLARRRIHRKLACSKCSRRLWRRRRQARAMSPVQLGDRFPKSWLHM